MADKRLDQTTNASAVAAADNIPFVTAAGVTSYVTGDELAASGPFSSRYVSQADDIRIDMQTCSSWNASTGAVIAPGLLPTGAQMVVSFPKTTPTAQQISWQANAVYIPTSWTTFDVKFVWMITSATSDDVMFRSIVSSIVADGTASSGTVGSDITIDLDLKTTGRYYSTTLRSGVTRGSLFGPTGYGIIRVDRRADQAGDTASVTVYGIALVLSKVS